MTFNLSMYLTVTDGSRVDWQATYRQLWTRRVTTGFVPTPGLDRVVLWPYEDDPADGPMWDVHRRYMDAGGCWHVELTTVVVDPSESARATLKSEPYFRPPYHYSSWHTVSDGDPAEGLRRGGWRPYREPPEGEPK